MSLERKRPRPRPLLPPTLLVLSSRGDRSVLTALWLPSAFRRLPSLFEATDSLLGNGRRGELAASSRVAVEAAVARPRRHTAGGWRGAASRWSAGAGGIGCRAGGAGAAHQIAEWRGRPPRSPAAG